MGITVQYTSTAETSEEFRDELIHEVHTRMVASEGVSAEDALRSLRDMLQALIFIKDEA